MFGSQLNDAQRAVWRLVGDMADLPESPGDVIRGIAVVFDDEEAHGGPL